MKSLTMTVEWMRSFTNHCLFTNQCSYTVLLMCLVICSETTYSQVLRMMRVKILEDSPYFRHVNNNRVIKGYVH